MALSLPEDPYLQTNEDDDIVGLTYRPIDELQEVERVKDGTAGAVCTFIGTTRDNFEGKAVSELEYEAYPSMALKTMMRIVCEARELSRRGAFSFDWPDYPAASSSTSVKNHPPTPPPPPSSDLINQAHSQPASHGGGDSAAARLVRVSLIHRLGVVGPKQASILIAVSSPHRKEAFRATEWILEEVKKRVEVWKREVYEQSGDSAWKENFPKSVEE